MAEPLPDGVAARAHRALDPLHSMIYFVPETEEEITAVGIRPGRMVYFAGRSAAMGPVNPGVTAATFYNFNPSLVERALPRAWTLATPQDVLAARLRAADRALRRLLGDVGTPDVLRAAELTRRATEALPVDGRALFAAHAGLPWPDEPHLVLWHAITLLREFRGDGHVAALLLHGLSGLEALVTHTATGRGFTVAAAQLTRGWTPEQWAEAEQDLRARGVLDEGGLTATGEQLRQAVEADTDRLAAAPWIALGADDVAELTAIGRRLAPLVAPAFPAEVFAARPRG